jgi:hypothetical protein
MDVQKGPTPFTEDEIKALDNPKFQREELENKYFIKATPEEIQDLWEQLPESMRVNTPRGDKKISNQQASQPEVKTKPEVVCPAKIAQSAPIPQTPKVETAEVKDDFLDDPNEPTETTQDAGPEDIGDDQPARLF